MPTILYFMFGEHLTWTPRFKEVQDWFFVHSFSAPRCTSRRNFMHLTQTLFLLFQSLSLKRNWNFFRGNASQTHHFKSYRIDTLHKHFMPQNALAVQIWKVLLWNCGCNFTFYVGWKLDINSQIKRGTELILCTFVLCLEMY